MLRAIALLLVGMQTASAVVITLDPADYAVGTNLSNIQDGLTISRLQWPDGSPRGAPLPPTRSDVQVTACAPYYSCLTPTTLGFGMTYVVNEVSACERGGGDCSRGVNALEFIFASPTDSVSMLFTFGSDPPIMHAYDINGALIDTCYTYYACGLFYAHDAYEYAATLTINRAERDIYRIVAGGNAGTSFAQHLSYSVPEPGTFALFGLGLTGLLIRRRPYQARLT